MLYALMMALSFIVMTAGLVLYRYKAQQTKILMACMIITSLFCLLLNVFWLCCYYFTGEGLNWAVVYTLTSSLVGAGIHAFILPGLIILITLSLVIFVGVKLTFQASTSYRRHQVHSIFSIFILIIAVIISPVWTQYQKSMLPDKNESSKDFYQYFIKPKPTIDNPQYNLVYIYGESLERTYFDDAHFPGLTRELGAYQQNALDFAKTEQYAGMDFTIAGIVSSQCGLPLFIPSFFGGSDAATSDFFAGQICLSDILKNSGYENYFYQGAELRFANKDAFFNVHGIDHIYGLSESKYKNDLSRQNEWGLYDDTVLEESWKKFVELSKAGKRFSLFTLTLDTHPPHGYIPKECKSNAYTIDGKSVDALSAVQCSQGEIARFVKKIIESEWSKNTIVVVSSDHLAMENTGVAIDYLKKYERHGLFFIIKDGVPASIINKKRNPMDNGATVLEMLGGGNNIGLGRSSLSRTSLSERFANFARKIIAWSPEVQTLWGIPAQINDYDINTLEQTLTFSGRKYPLPLLVGFEDEKPKPVTDRRGGAPLRFKLARLKSTSHFLWVDRCFQMANVWASQDKNLVLSQDWCLAEGNLSGPVSLTKITDAQWHGALSKEVKDISEDKQAKAVADKIRRLLSRRNREIRYPSDAVLFNLDGMPEGMKDISGLGSREFWGSWSDANMAPTVQLTWQESLPSEFWLEIKAKAYGENTLRPTLIKVGGETLSVQLGKEITLNRLHFTHASGNQVEVIAPHPELSREGNLIAAPLDAPMRKIGVGLESIRIVKPEMSDPGASK